jgi:protein translocase SecG subunit
MIFITTLKVIHIVLCVLVVMGVLFMNQKSEGLSGIMGGTSYSSRGAKGMDEGMRKMITWLGAGLLLSAVILDIIDRSM